MRLPISLVIFIGLNVTAHAQATDERAAGQTVDLSGIYVGGPAIGQPEAYPFTPQGALTQRAHDPLIVDPSQYDDCAREPMPRLILWGATIMQIAQEDTRITMRVERGDSVRTIHINGSQPGAAQAHTELGYSVGHWDAGVLTVETTHLTGGIMFADEGFPSSEQTRLTERYWRNPGERNLQMELVIEDPVNYAQPVTLAREWIWSPDERVRPYDCVNLGSRGGEPLDVEEVRRILEQLD